MKRIPKWAKTHPLTANLIIVMIIFSVGFWRVEHLYSCAQDYAANTATANRSVREAASQLQDADDKGWAAIEDVLGQHADQADIDQLRRAAREHRILSDELDQAREENPVPEPPGTFC